MSKPSLLEILERLESVDIAIHPERCAVVRNRNSRCHRCADACTSAAIALETNSITVTADLCIGCGTCATACPTAAIEALNPSDNELLRAAVRVLHEHEAEPIFACRKLLEQEKNRYDRSRVIQVACLGRVEEAEIIALLAIGSPSITLALGNCTGCENTKGTTTIRLVQDTTATLLDAWGADNHVRLLEGLPDDAILDRKAARLSDSADGISRRDFFNQLQSGAKSTIAQAASSQALFTEPTRRDITSDKALKVLKDGTLPHFIPNRRERLLDHLDALGSPIADSIDTRLWGHVLIDEDRCNACRMCATFCPTGAITRFTDSDETFGIEHYPADCVQCRLCEDICATKALTLVSEVPLSELVEGQITRYVMNGESITDLPNEKKAVFAMQQKLKDIPIYERG